MHKYKTIFYYIDDFNKKDILKLDKRIILIYRNYNKITHHKKILNFVKFCKKHKYKLYISNNYKLAIKYKLDGLYIPSFNKSLRYKNLNAPKKMDIIGSAHNISEIIIKKKQQCSKIFISPIFKSKNSRKMLGVVRFNLMLVNFKLKFIALGGVNEKNLKLLNLTKVLGVAAISWIKKNRPRKTRPV